MWAGVYMECVLSGIWNGRICMCCMCVGRYICGGELLYMGYVCVGPCICGLCICECICQGGLVYMR